MAISSIETNAHHTNDNMNTLYDLWLTLGVVYFEQLSAIELNSK